jgi:NTE family protein
VRIGLVLGAGGIVGHAYHATVLAALGRVTAWSADDAEIIIGTSAGSGIGAVIRGGGDPAELISRILEAPSHPDAIDRVQRMTTPEPRSSAGLIRLPAAPRLALGGLLPPWRPRVAPVIAGLLPEGRVHTSVMGEHPRDLHGDTWPERELWVCATSLADGELVVFGREGAPETDVGTAVEASCAIPTYFRQVTIDGVRYVDGGVHSPTNADLLVGRDLDLVVVISPMSGTTGAARSFPPLGRGYFTRKLHRELAPIEEAGIPVLVLEPTLDEARVMGFNPMDPAKRVQVMLQSGASALRFLATPEVEHQVEILRKAAANPPVLPAAVADDEPPASDPAPGSRR